MRFFGALPTVPEAYEIINWTVNLLTHKRGTANPTEFNRNLFGTNLLSLQGDAIATLDEPTSEASFHVLTEFPGVSPGGYFFWFDIPVAYDPCICYNDVAIEMHGQLIKTATLTASGTLLGTVQEVKTPNTSNYSQLVAKKVIGTGIALGVAVATKGAILQIGKFAELAGVLANNPNLSADDKKNWEMFKKFLESSDKLTRKDNMWVDWLTKETLKDKDVATMIGSINTFISSTMDINNKGGGNKTVTTVTGKINLTGTVSQKNTVQQSPYWSAPGSSLSLECEEEVTNVPNTQQKNPEYPLYNEALGTFAFLKPPKLKLDVSRVWEYSTNQFVMEEDPQNPGFFIENYWSCHGLKLLGYLGEDLSFAINPKTNINWDKTKITAMISFDMEKQGATENWKWELMDAQKIPLQFKSSMNTAAIAAKNPINMVSTIDPTQFLTAPVDLDDLREVYFEGRVIATDYSSFIQPINPVSVDDIDPSFIPKVYLKLYVEYESTETGKDGKPIRNVQMFTVPLEIETFDPVTNPFPHPKYNMVTTEIIELDQPSGQHFTADEVIYAKTINITTDLSVDPGVTLIIRATESINVSPNAQIGPGVILEIVENPFSGLYPQNPKNSTYLASFCSGQTNDPIYRANQWAGAKVVTSHANDSSYNNYFSSRVTNQNAFVVWPNPTRNSININCYSSNAEPLKVILLDGSGREISSESYKHSYDISALASGLYFIRVAFSDGSSVTKRLVKAN